MSINKETLAAAKAYTDKNAGGGGTGGTTNYNQLTNLPRINGIELTGNKTSAELGLPTQSETEALSDISEKADVVVKLDESEGGILIYDGQEYEPAETDIDIEELISDTISNIKGGGS